MKFRVLRNLWLRGEGPSVSALRRAGDGKQCCLGFFAEACGVKTDALTGSQSPCNLWSVDRELMPAWLFPAETVMRSVPSNAASELMDVNDRRDVSEEFRETKLTELFAKVGVDVEFV